MKIIKLGDYKKEKCGICGEEHVCIDVFTTKVCPECFKEFGRYRNMVNNIIDRDSTDKYSKALSNQIKKENIAKCSPAESIAKCSPIAKLNV